MLKKLIFKSFSLPSVQLLPLRTKYYFASDLRQRKVGVQQQISRKVIKILAQTKKCDEEKIKPSATFKELGFDSLDTVDLVISMEETFKIDIPNQEANHINSVQNAVAVFSRHIENQPNHELMAGQEEKKKSQNYSEEKGKDGKL